MVENTSRRVPVDTSEAHWPHLFEPFRNMAASVANYFSPSADAASGMEDYEINMELPGVSADDIDVSLNDHVLTVKGEKKSSREEKTKTYYFSERSYGAFQRSFRLPGDVNTDQIEAAFVDGVLTLSLPKTGGAAQAQKKIRVQIGLD
jgi:HSP20 family protein